MASSLADFHRMLRHAYSEPKSEVVMSAPVLTALAGHNEEVIDPDWWEPRYDQPCRRLVARDRQEFGGEYVAKAKPPVEGPNNPNRLRRELVDARFDLVRANASLDEAQETCEDALLRIAALEEKLRGP